MINMMNFKTPGHCFMVSPATPNPLCCFCRTLLFVIPAYAKSYPFSGTKFFLKPDTYFLCT